MKNWTGTFRGDYKILYPVGLEHYKCKCVHCGRIREYSTSTVARGRMVCSCPHERVKICRHCKREFKTKQNEVFCSAECRKAYYKSRNKNGENIYKTRRKSKNRKIDDTTRMLVCVYTEEGLSIKEVAMWLNRSERAIRKILTTCKKNGKYDYYINKSPWLEALRRKRCI